MTTTRESTTTKALTPIPVVDLYDALLAGLFHECGSFRVDSSDMRRYGRMLFRLYLDVCRSPVFRFDEYRRSGWEQASDERGLRYRIASLATIGLVYHWTDNSVQPRGIDTMDLVGHLYRLPADQGAWMRRFRFILATTH